jgi:Flp pilus assembly protein TadG
VRSVRRGGGDDGVTLALFALLLVTLLTFVAIVVDLGNGRQERRVAQNRVDAAALAATSAYDGTPATQAAAQTQGLRYLAANGLNVTTTASALNTYSCTGAQSCTVNFAFPNDTQRCVLVEIRNYRVDTTFARVIGQNQLNVSSQANGCTRQIAGTAAPLPAAEAHGTCSNSYEAFEIAGQNNRFEGDIESWGGARDGAASGLSTTNTKTGSARVRIAPPSDKIGVWSGYSIVPPNTGPDEVSAALGQTRQEIIDSFKPGGSRAVFAQNVGLYNRTDTAAGTPEDGFRNNDWSPGATILAGIYYTDKKIALGNNGVNVVERVGLDGNTYRGVILVSGGDMVTISGNGARLTPFRRVMPDEQAGPAAANNSLRLTVVAGRSSSNGCSDTGFSLSGECNRVDGVIYVPYAKALNNGNGGGHDRNTTVSGFPDSSNCTSTPNYRGALIAYSMKLEGNYNLWRGGSGGTSTTPEVYLDQ